MPYAGEARPGQSQTSGSYTPVETRTPEGMMLPPSGGGGGGGGGFGAYTGPMSPEYNYSNLGKPEYTYSEFKAPTAEEAFSSPGYQFRMGQGQQALERSAAAKGLLRSGGTLKDILGYGQNFASQEYQNVFNRSFEAAKLKSEQETQRNMLLSGDYQTRFKAEVQRALQENMNQFNSWAKQGDWANRSSGGGGYEEPMPTWEEPEY